MEASTAPISMPSDAVVVDDDKVRKVTWAYVIASTIFRTIAWPRRIASSMTASETSFAPASTIETAS